MADSRFFHKSKPMTLSELAEVSDARILRGKPEDVFEDVAPLDQAKAGHFTFFDNARYKSALQNTKAGACILNKEAVQFAPDHMALLVSQSPYKGYAKIAQAFYPDPPPAQSRISEHAVIAESANIGKNCVIEPFAVIGENCKIGDSTYIGAHSVIHAGCFLGQGCKISAHVTITHALIGDDVSLYTGVRIGQDGFGFAIDPAGHVKVPQLGRVIIEDHVEIGANTTIDRGAGPDTVIGSGTWIDNLVQIGHNVKIGRGVVIVAQVGIAGSTVIDDFVAIGGQVGIAGHLHIGKGAQIAGQSGVSKNVGPGEKLMGSPAMPMKAYMKQIAFLKRMLQNKE